MTTSATPANRFQHWDETEGFDVNTRQQLGTPIFDEEEETIGGDWGKKHGIYTMVEKQSATLPQEQEEKTTKKDLRNITNKFAAKLSGKAPVIGLAFGLPSFIVILTDELEQGYGPSLIEELKTTAPNTHTLIFLNKETAAVVEECLESGAEGICFSSNVADGDGDFVKALRAIAKRGVYYPEEVKKKAGYVGSNPFAMVLPNDITEREKEVLVGLTEGLSNKELAESLFLSVETIKSHLKSLTQKLGVKDRTGAAIFGVKAGVSRS